METKLPQPNELLLYWGGRPLVEHMHLFASEGTTRFEAACGVRDNPTNVLMGGPPPLEHRCKTCETVWKTENTPIALMVRKAIHAPLWAAPKEVKLVASTLAFELAKVQREVEGITNRLRAITTIFD